MATIEYEINGNGLNVLDPILGTQDPVDFYDYTGSGAPSSGWGDHGYGSQHDVVLWVYHNQSEDQFAVIASCGLTNQEVNGPWGCDINFSETISTGDYVVKDDPNNDLYNTFGSSRSKHGWGNQGSSSSSDSSDADGWAIKANGFRDVSFTISENTELKNQEEPDLNFPNDFGIIDGNLPNYTTLAQTGDQVILLTENLAVHGRN